MNYCSHLKVESIFCSICKLKEETILHLFYECIKAQILLLQLYSLCNDSFSFPVLTPRNEIFEYINTKWIIHKSSITFFKMHSYCSRETRILNYDVLKAKIIKVRNVEEEIARIKSINSRVLEKVEHFATFTICLKNLKVLDCHLVLKITYFKGAVSFVLFLLI